MPHGAVLAGGGSVFAGLFLKKEEKNVKSIRLFLLPAAAAAVMLSPLILKGTDDKFRFSGVENQTGFPEITAQKLLDGQAQTEFEAYVQQHLPGKPFMVRLRNEITFSLLDTVSNINYSMSRDKNLFSWENVSYYLRIKSIDKTGDEGEDIRSF